VTPDEIKIATAFYAVTFPPSTKTKSLAASLARMATDRPDHELSVRQRAALLDIAIKYCRQIPVELVDLARTLKGEE